MKSSKSSRPTHFTTVPLVAVPQNRRGKHAHVVDQIMSDLSELPAGSALRIPISSFQGEKLANIRAALNRATNQRKLRVATTADASHLYIWMLDGHRKRRMNGRQQQLSKD